MENNPNGWIIFIAILGAAAWIPHIIQLIIKIFSKPSLISINQKEIEIGFNTLGPIINFSLAFIAEKEKALIQKIDFTLKHSSNESHLFKWIWYEESLFQMDLQKVSIPYKKYQNAIALNVAKDSMVEKKIGFQSIDFKEKLDPLAILLKEDIANLKNSEEELDKIKSRKSYNDLVSHLNNSCIWKIGKYEAEINIYVLKRRIPFKHRLVFDLNNMDLKNLQDNIQLCKDAIDNVIFSAEKKSEPAWNWVYCQDLKDTIMQIKP